MSKLFAIKEIGTFKKVRDIFPMAYKSYNLTNEEIKTIEKTS